MAKQITYGHESRRSIRRGVNRLAGAQMQNAAGDSAGPAMPPGGGVY